MEEPRDSPEGVHTMVIVKGKDLVRDFLISFYVTFNQGISFRKTESSRGLE